MRPKPKKSMLAGIFFGIAMAVSFGVMLGPVGIALGVPFMFLGKTMFRELDKTDKTK